MDWKQEIEKGQKLVQERRFDLAIEQYRTVLEGCQDEPKYYYWTLKHYADLIGFIYGKDYFRAIDMYQEIINNYEEEDGLYEWCQVDMAKSYLNAGMDMFEAFENMTEFLEPLNDQMSSYIATIMEAKEDFITERAEVIYKSRL
jgi:tetratricopeptide (TPR) repeat protein